MAFENLSKHDVFLSFAQQDLDLAKALSDLLEKCEINTFFAPNNLVAKGAQDWRSNLLAAIKDSTTFIPIITQNSKQKPWVNYEAGVASACEKPIYPVKTSNVDTSKQDSANPIVNLQQVFDLTKKGDIKNLFCILYEIKHQRNARRKKSLEINEPAKATLKYIGDLLDKNELLLKKVNILAGRRAVFIAGSLPKDDVNDSNVTKNLSYDIPKITAELTRELLKNKFTVGSCPVVEGVGRIVADEAQRFIRDNPDQLDAGYEIGGLYPLYPLKGVTLGSKEEELWRKLFRGFRETYLTKYEWLVVIGGNEGTREEFDAAREIGTLKIISLPFLGGTGYLIRNHIGNQHHDVIKSEMPHWTSATIREIVKHMKETL